MTWQVGLLESNSGGLLRRSKEQPRANVLYRWGGVLGGHGDISDSSEGLKDDLRAHNMLRLV